jgi:hypothetical protein
MAAQQHAIVEIKAATSQFLPRLCSYTLILYWIKSFSLSMAEAGSEAGVSSDAAPTIKPKIVEKVRAIPFAFRST